MNFAKPLLIALSRRILLFVVLSGPLNAQTAITWSSTSDTTFSTGTNWAAGSAPTDSLTNNIATFTTLASGANPVLTTSQRVAGVSFTGSTNTYTFSNSGGAILTLGSSGISTVVSSRTETISVPLVLGASQIWLSNAPNSVLTLSGTVDLNGFALTLQSGTTGTTSNLNVSNIINGTGGGSINKTGNSTLTLSAANTFSGGTTLTLGTLNLNNGGTGGSSSAIGTGTFTVAASTTIDNTSGSPVTLSTNNVQAWNGNLTFTGTNDLNLGTGAVTLGANRTVSASGGTLTVGGAIGGAFGLTKAGAGTLTLSNTASTYSGPTTINGGILSVNTLANGGSNSGIGSSASNATNLVIDGGTLQYTGSTVSTDRKIKIGNTTTGGAATLDASGSGALTFSATGTSAFAYGTNNQTRSLTLTGSNFSDNTLSGILTDNGSGLTSLIKAGVGKWILTGANTYTGGTTLNAGTLSFANGSLGVSGAITMNGGTLQWNGSNTQDISSRFTMVASTAAIVDTNGNNVSFANAIGGSTSGSLAKFGTGTLTLSAANTYSGGTTVSAGTLTASHASALGSGSATVNSSSTFNVNGVAVANQVTLNSGTLTGTGSLTGTGANALTGSGAINSSFSVAAFNWTLTNASTFNSLTLAATSTLILNTLNLSFGPNMSPAQGNVLWNSNQSWVVVDGTTGSSITSTSLGSGSSGYANGTFGLSTLNNDLTLTWTASAIPEPSTYAAIFGTLALVGTVWRRRRHRKAA